MSKTVVKVEDVSKLYRLGQVGTGTITNDLKRWWHQVRGKEDPFMKIGQSNDRTKDEGTLDYVWSLKDINFEVKEGEVLGIIGKNGAGKSTLLKILSKITAPTQGRISIEGRVASLLEVGTGFHPELTGRENVFLNGTILGMNKAEVNSKLEEIVDFSGVAKYLDTPVKRYSSGMLVRLGFAVAAHLEPEILIVDEVLAVGDAEFQKKCVGKMKDVSGEGRTVLFVSHNMAAVRSLCNRAIYLEQGLLKKSGNTDDIVNNYLLSNSQSNGISYTSGIQDKDCEDFHLREANINLRSHEKLILSSAFDVNFSFEFFKNMEVYFSILFLDFNEQVIFNYATDPKDIKKGKCVIDFEVPGHLLNDNEYFVNLAICSKGKVLHVYNSILNFNVKETEERTIGWYGKWLGTVRPKLEYRINQ